jgi:predicted TIM-barrel enzyme
MARFTRQQILDRLNAKIRSGQPIVGGGAGTGLSAKCEEAGGIDLIVIYNSGRYRMAGRGSLAGLLSYGNANDIVMEMAAEVLPVTRNTPVLAGVNGTDPFCIFDHFLDQLRAVGFAGVQNFPTVGLIDGSFRQNLEETGMGFGLEVDMIRMAHEKDMLTTPYVFSEDDAIAISLDDCVDYINAWSEAALKKRRDVIVLCHGGPISMPADAEYVLKRCPECNGFYGASSMERLPTEKALVAQTRDFLNIKRN